MNFIPWASRWIFLNYSIRLEITADAVRVRFFGFQPKTQVARSQIRAIHYYPDIVGFRGPDGKPAMRTRCEWSLKQMIAVAAELRVPVYDNRGTFHLLGVKMGQLVYDPADGSREHTPLAAQVRSEANKTAAFATSSAVA